MEVFGSNMDEVHGKFGILHNEQIRSSYISPSSVTIMKIWGLRLAVYVDNEWLQNFDGRETSWRREVIFKKDI